MNVEGRHNLLLCCRVGCRTGRTLPEAVVLDPVREAAPLHHDRLNRAIRRANRLPLAYRDGVRRPAEAAMFFDEGTHKLRCAGFMLGTIHHQCHIAPGRRLFGLETLDNLLHNRCLPPSYSLYRDFSREAALAGYKLMHFHPSPEKPLPNASKKHTCEFECIGVARAAFLFNCHSLCPRHTEVGDLVVLLIGRSVPAILRPLSTQG